MEPIVAVLPNALYGNLLLYLTVHTIHRKDSKLLYQPSPMVNKSEYK